MLSSICIVPIDEPEFEPNLLESLSSLHKQTILLFIQANQYFLECNISASIASNHFNLNGIHLNVGFFRFISDPHSFPDYCTVLANELNKLGDQKDKKQWLHAIDKWTDDVRYDKRNISNSMRFIMINLVCFFSMI